MIFKETIANLKWLVHSLGVANRSQLKLFFSDVNTPDQINRYINYLSDKHYFTYQAAECKSEDKVYARDLAQTPEDEKNEGNEEKIRYNPLYQFNEEIEQAIISLFWAIVAFKSKNIKEVRIVDVHPVQILFIISDDRVYDITYCNKKTFASLASDKIKKHQKENEEDEVYHIAMVNNHELGQQMGIYGFDCYCILDKEKKPMYYD